MKPDSSSAAGTWFWLAVIRSVVWPIAVRIAQVGTPSIAGRCSAAATARTTSAWLFVAGAARLTGPLIGLSISQVIARTSSTRLIQGQIWLPGPNGPPTPRRSNGHIGPSAPARGAITRPVRKIATRLPASAAGRVASSHWRTSSAMKPVPPVLCSVSGSVPRSP